MVEGCFQHISFFIMQDNDNDNDDPFILTEAEEAVEEHNEVNEAPLIPDIN